MTAHVIATVSAMADLLERIEQVGSRAVPEQVARWARVVVLNHLDRVVGNVIGRPAVDQLRESILHGAGDLPVREITVGGAR